MKKIINILIGTFMLVSLASCELAGLELQRDAKFVPKATDNNVPMTAWEFIQSRPDIFSGMQEAIEYTGLQELYQKESGNTYILLTNTALIDWENTSHSYFRRYLVGGVHANSWKDYPPSQVAEMLRYHIVKGEYSFFNLDASTIWAETYGNGDFTYTVDGVQAKGDTAVLAMTIGYDRNMAIQFNNYSWNYRGVLAVSSGSCRTTNLHLTNGYAHVTDYDLERPTRKFLGLE